MPEPTAARRRAAHMALAVFVVDMAAFLTVRIVWPGVVTAMFAGWCLSWLTAVVWLNFQDARAASQETASEGGSNHAH